MNGIAQIHDGKLGDLILLQAYWNGGGIWWRDGQEGWSEMKKQVDNWYHYCWLSGDNICEQHIHNLDVCNWAKNASSGRGQRHGWRPAPPRTQSADPRSSITTSWSSPIPTARRCTASAGTSRTRFNRVDEYAFGTKGNGSMQADGDVKDANGRRFQVR